MDGRGAAPTNEREVGDGCGAEQASSHNTPRTKTRVISTKITFNIWKQKNNKYNEGYEALRN